MAWGARQIILPFVPNGFHLFLFKPPNRKDHKIKVAGFLGAFS
jgi:hypothetical protein